MNLSGEVSLDYGMREYTTVTVNGAEIAYLDVGDGQPVVLIAGALADFRTWESLIGELRSSYRIVAVTVRRAFPNPPSRDPLLPSETDWSDVDDVIAVLDHLNLRQAHVLGHSLGGAIAMAIALQRPDLVASLVLEEPPVLPYEETSHAVGAAIGRLRSGDVEGGLRDFMDVSSGPGYFDKVSRSLQQSILQNVGTLAFGNPPPSITCEQAESISVPVLFIEGELTPISTEIKHCFKRCEKVVVPLASHASHTNNPLEFNRAVVKFLKNLE